MVGGLTILLLLGIEMKTMQRNKGCWGNLIRLDLKKQEVLLRSPRRLDSWRLPLMNGKKDLGVFVVSMDAKQAFTNVTPLNLSETMTKMGVNTTLTEAVLRQQMGVTYDVCFHGNKGE